MNIPSAESSGTPDPRSFYEQAYAGTAYANKPTLKSHNLHVDVVDFVTRYQLAGSKVVEIGCGRGAFQDLVEDYTGVDLSENAGAYHRKKFVVADATRLPFPDAEFEALWSIYAIEHIPDPEAALREMRRVVKPGGYMLVKPAWHCRWWVCHGVTVRGFRDLNLRLKLVKLAVPVLQSAWFRALTAIPRRAVLPLLPHYRKGHKLWWKRLPADFEHYWCPDSDAVAYLDPAAVALWFEAHGDQVISCPPGWRRWFLRDHRLIIRRGPRL